MTGLWLWLRDMQLLRWVGFARYGQNSPDSLQLIGELDQDDHAALLRALEFMLRARNELHFHAQKAQSLRCGRVESGAIILDGEHQRALGLTYIDNDAASLRVPRYIVQGLLNHTIDTGAQSVG